MLRELYKQYIKISRGVSERSVGHYITGLNTINAILLKSNFPINDIFSVKSIEELNSIKEFLQRNEEFRSKDAIGHNMYSVAFKHFFRFANEDERFFSHSIQQMDIPIVTPKQTERATHLWERNQIIKSQALRAANYICEYDHSHLTFTAKATNKPYMEGHHLIPIKFQPEFKTSIDVYSNVVCLCPICHRLLHYGADREKIYAAEKIFDFRSERLSKSGIDITKTDFIRLING